MAAPDPTSQIAPPEPAVLAELHQALLAWFATHARDLPWRHTRDPYRILVSEVMLQQTQVERVLPKYAAFLAAFPTLADLAAAPTAEVIKQWAGLGYNRRAVNLQRTARAVLADHGGTFPQQVDELRRLPGIGPYTAGALACFAFEQDVAFMDTNIRRVVRRLLVGAETAEPPTGERVLLHLAGQVIPAGQGWAWNQGMMELGAIICTAAAPACWRCPLHVHCRAYSGWRAADANVFAEAPPTEQPYVNRVTTGKTKRVAERRSAPFVGSNRYYRGQIIEQLRALPPGEHLPLTRLGPLLKPDFDPAADIDWLRGLLEGLQRDGLLELVHDTVCLPDT
jgi:A/G-specific adenine glycosylase